jgi:uncharacterized repeat protein (TIGR03803 family)
MDVLRRALIAFVVLICSAPATAQEDYVVLKATATAGGLVKTPDGTIFGTGGDTGAFKITPEGTYTEIAPPLPYGASMLASDGYFYGANGSSIFRFPPSGPVELLHRVDNNHLEGSFSTGLVEGQDGALYGFNRSGGFNPGRVYRMTPAGVITTVHEFVGEHEALTVNLIAGRDGNLYGTTWLGNANQIFRLTLAGGFTTLHLFAIDMPAAPLLEAHDGFYGTTAGGNGVSCGSVFHLRPDGAFQTLHRFTTAEGCGSLTALIEAADGQFYGTTEATIFSISRDGTFRLLHSTQGVPGYAGSDRYGWGYSPLVQGNDGNFYGAAKYGGQPANNGVVFRLNALRSPCLNDVRLVWRGDASGGNLYFVGAIKTETPAFLATFFISSAGVTPISVGAIPAITPALAYELAAPILPMGTVGLLSILITADLHVCSAWQMADTGGAAAQPARPPAW